MPYPNEHAARMVEPDACEDKSFKRMNQGKGVSLILCKQDGKMKAQAYRFNKDMFTPEQAKAWLKKHNLKALSFEKASEVKAKLSMKASLPEVDGRIWSAGMHHVFVNDKPARIYVPEETIMQTFESVRGLIKDQGRMPIGIDHLSDGVLGDNEILAKMNLLDVGNVTKVGTDGQSIYILDSELTNDSIKALHSQGELPAFSIVGSMDAQPCPTGKADYVVKGIDVERVDFVQEGGCSVCKVGAQPDELILTSRKSNEEVDKMDKDVNETVATPVEEEVVEAPVDEAVEEVEAVEEEVVEVVEDEPKEEVVEVAAEELEEEPSELQILRDEIAELKKELGGKKPKVEASSSEFDPETAVTQLIEAGKALPKMKKALLEVAQTSEEGFKAMAASMPKFVNMKMESKLAKIEEQTTPKKPKKKSWEEEYGDLAKVFRV